MSNTLCLYIPVYPNQLETYLYSYPLELFVQLCRILLQMCGTLFLKYGIILNSSEQ